MDQQQPTAAAAPIASNLPPMDKTSQPDPDPPSNRNRNRNGGDNSSSTSQDNGDNDGTSAAAYESEHVHSVYEAIAPHFSATRHKPWPYIANFLNSLAPGSIGLDVGCGNGKYLPVNPLIHMLGSDRSPALLRLAQERGRPEGTQEKEEKQDVSSKSGDGGGANETGDGDSKYIPSRHDVLVADTLQLPYQTGRFDFVICIAVIHHLSTQSRRRDAIRALLECSREAEGRVLVYVWALEQGDSRRGWDKGSDQDTLVPWVMKRKGQEDSTYQRYYHLYKQGELEGDVEAVGGTVVESGYERDNWWAICHR